MKPVHEEVSEILTDDLSRKCEEDRLSCPIEARKKAMDYLARREHARAELLRKLTDKGFVRNIAEEAVTKLAEDGLQSDERFAESFALSRLNQGKGPVRIRMDLRARGVDDASIEFAIDELGANWYELAREVRQRKFGAESPDEFKERARQMRFLQYRGFEQDHIQSAFAGD